MQLTRSIRRLSQIHPSGTATIFAGRRRDWTGFRTRVERLAGALQGLGVKPGDRVAILALNSDRYFEYYFAVPWAGGVVVPMNVRWSVAENAYALTDSGAEILFVDDHFLAHAGAITVQSPTLRHTIHMGDGKAPAGMLSYERLVEEAAPVGDAGRKDEDLAGIFYTGGTTGFPKGVMLPHRGLWTSAVGLQQTLSLGRDSTYLHAAPMFHLADGAISFGASLAGAAHVMIPSFDPAAALAAIEEHRVTHILLVPTMIKMVLDHPDLGRRDLSSLRQVVYGASPIPESVLGDAIRKLPNCRFTQLYGQTELSPVATELGPEYHVLEGPLAGQLRSAGRATVCTEVEIIDAEGRVVPRGTVGQITVAGPVTMLGYWNKPDETARTLVDGWVRTGDAGYMDEDGFIYVVDRVKDMIISGGENVYSAEVENALAKHPAVSGCVVIGIPSEKWGEAVHAIVILRDGQQATEADLIDHCKSLIAGYKCPRSIEFRKEPFPVSGAGKILKRELRAPYWKDASRQVN